MASRSLQKFDAFLTFFGTNARFVAKQCIRSKKLPIEQIAHGENVANQGYFPAY